MTVIGAQRWPELPYEVWKDTCETLHLWTQVIGKIRLTLTPWLNHSWHVALYVTARGLTTSPISDGARPFQIDFDFIDHLLRVTTSDGHSREIMLRPMAVAEFYRQVMAVLEQLDIVVRLRTMPCEIADCIPFELDSIHAAYEAEYVNRFWRVLLAASEVFSHFRTGFLGKASPVHFFWGSFDLAVTRFSGRNAPRHPGGVPIFRTQWHERPIRTRCRVQASGPAAVGLSTTARSTLMPIPPQRVLLARK